MVKFVIVFVRYRYRYLYEKVFTYRNESLFSEQIPWNSKNHQFSVWKSNIYKDFYLFFPEIREFPEGLSCLYLAESENSFIRYT